MNRPPQKVASIVDTAAEILNPPPDLEVYDWAEKNITLSDRVTARPGKLDWTHSPYMRGRFGPLWGYRRYRENVWIFGAQCGKTLGLQAIMAYNAATRPGPTLIVYPNMTTCDRRSSDHLRPMIEDCMSAQLTGRRFDLQKHYFRLKSCSIKLAWAGSPTMLAAEAIRYLFLDEAAKFPKSSGDETDPVNLSWRRTRTYENAARGLITTTPVTESKAGWKQFATSTQHQFWIPCPDCGVFQVPFPTPEVARWFDVDNCGSGGVHFDPDATDAESISATSYFECSVADCGSRWTDQQLNDAVALGEWRARFPDASGYGCWLPSICSQWSTIGDLAVKMDASEKSEDDRQDFLNSDCAVPYELRVTDPIDVGGIRSHIVPGHVAGTVPSSVRFVFLTADVHDANIRYRVRAWATDTTSFGIEEGTVRAELDSLDPLMSRTWTIGDNDARKIGVDMAMVDGRYRTQEVLQWCMKWDGRAYPAFGTDTLRELYRWTTKIVTPDPASGRNLEGALQSLAYNHQQYMDKFAAWLRITPGAPGYMGLEEKISAEYCQQMIAEQRITIEKGNQQSTKWQQVARHNHALDCEKMQIIMRDVFDVAAYWEQEQQTIPEPASDPSLPDAPVAETPRSPVLVNPFTGKQTKR